jgi:hypothetical protein
MLGDDPVEEVEVDRSSRLTRSRDAECAFASICLHTVVPHVVRPNSDLLSARSPKSSLEDDEERTGEIAGRTLFDGLLCDVGRIQTLQCR